MNKQGNILDWFFIIAILFLTVVVLLVSSLIMSTVNNTQIFSDYPEAQAGMDSATNTILGFDNLMIFIVVGLSIFVLVSSAVVFNHPAYFIAGLFLLMIAIVVAAVGSNAFYDFVQNPVIAAEAANYPKLLFLFNNLPIYIGVLGILALVGMFISYQRT